jgi:hypothetical protein
MSWLASGVMHEADNMYKGNDIPELEKYWNA